MKSILYRAHQFWRALYSPSLTESDLAPAQSVLTERQMALFTRLQSSEQAHGLRVLQTLQNLGEDHPDLLVAALLHDVGKICHPLRLWERVIIVLGAHFFPAKMARWGSEGSRRRERAFYVAREHPRWGAELAHEAGASWLAVQLIRRHQDDLPPEAPNMLENQLLSTLQKADNQN